MPPVHLRPVSQEDLDVFASSFIEEDGCGPFQWFGHRGSHRDLERFRDNGLLSAEGGAMSIFSNGELTGRVDWFKSSWGRPDESWCWSIGVGVFQERRGQGIGTEAQRQLVDYLFAHTRVHRIQAWTDARNEAEQRALGKIGFTKEGVLREAQWRGGAWHDQVLYSRLRTD